jgi:hypothetical protein
MKAKEAVEIFSRMNPDDEVWITYMSKDDVAEAFEGQEITDENDNLIDTTPFITNGTVEMIMLSMDNDDYLWERFNDTFTDTCAEVLNKLLQEVKDDTELWDKEITNESK